MAIECDVLVVGAGPAGSVAAFVCAKYGLDTILIEKNSDIGGHTSTKLDASSDEELSRIIDELRLKTENKVYTSRWYPPSGNYFLLRSGSPEYFFKRGPDDDSFEVSTTNQAEEAGCRIHLGTKIEKIKKVNGHIDSILLKKGGEKIHVKPKVLVAADGGNSIFHQFVRKRSENRKKIGYGCSGKYFSDLESSNIYFDAELMRGGYFYLITGRSGISSACIILDFFNTKKSARSYFEKFLAKNKRLTEKIKSPTDYFGGEGRIFELDKCVNKNLIFVGDAAGLLDPFFGYGMASAIVSGYYAGKYIKKSLEKSLDLLEGYDQKIKEKYDKRLSYVYQRIFESLNNDDLELIAEILNELGKRVEIDEILRQLSEM